jgi:hypothetical protein
MTPILSPRIPIPGEPIINGSQLSETQDLHIFEGTKFVRTERFFYFRDVKTGALSRVEFEIVDRAEET